MPFSIEKSLNLVVCLCTGVSICGIRLEGRIVVGLMGALVVSQVHKYCILWVCSNATWGRGARRQDWRPRTQNLPWDSTSAPSYTCHAAPRRAATRRDDGRRHGALADRLLLRCSSSSLFYESYPDIVPFLCCWVLIVSLKSLIPQSSVGSI